MEGSQFYSDWIFDEDYFNFEDRMHHLQQSDSRLDRFNNFLRQVTTGIDSAQRLRNPYPTQHGQYPYQQQPHMMNAGMNPAYFWLIGGAVFIGGVAWLSKKHFDER